MVSPNYIFKSPSARGIVGKLPNDLPSVSLNALEELMNPSMEPGEWTLTKLRSSCANALLNIPGLGTSACKQLEKSAKDFEMSQVAYWEAAFQKGLKGEALSAYCDSMASSANAFDREVTSAKAALDANAATALDRAVKSLRFLQYSTVASAVAVLESAASGEAPGQTLRQIEPTAGWETTTPTDPSVRKSTGIGSAPPPMPQLPPTPLEVRAPDPGETLDPLGEPKIESGSRDLQ